LIGCTHRENGKITASGVIEAIEVNVGSKVIGELTNVAFEEGQIVKKNDLLAEVDCRDYDLQVNQAAASLDSMKAQYNLVMNGARSEDIQQAVAGDIQAQANYVNAKINYERTQKLFEKNIVPRKLLDDAETKFQVAEAQVAQSKEAVKKVKNISRSEDIAMTKARVENADWFLQSMQKKAADCKIISPIDGFVLKKVYEPGEYVMPGSTVAVLTDLKKVKVVVYLPEADVFKIKYGQKVLISVDGFKDKAIPGTVSFISQEAEFTPKNIQTKDERVKLMFAVRMIVDNAEFILKPGLPADAEFQ
jgi:membrane fusion protein YbhG